MTSMENNRKYALKCRLKKQLARRKESLADDFQFKIYAIFHFEQKPCTIYESADIINVMTNDLKDQIVKNSKIKSNSNNNNSSNNSVASTTTDALEDMFSEDVVQLHLTSWVPHFKSSDDVHGLMTNVDFLIYPRRDVTKIDCHLFSRWRDQPMQAYLPLQCKFTIHCNEWSSKLQRMAEADVKASSLTSSVTSSERIVANEARNMFMFIKKQQIQTNTGKVMNLMKMNGLCLYIPQDKLLSWEARTLCQVLADDCQSYEKE